MKMLTILLLSSFLFVGRLYATNYGQCTRQKQRCLRDCENKHSLAEEQICKNKCESTRKNCKTSKEERADCLDTCRDTLDNKCEEDLAEKDDEMNIPEKADTVTPETADGCQLQYDNTICKLKNCKNVQYSAQNKLMNCLTNARRTLKDCNENLKNETLGEYNSCHDKCKNKKPVTTGEETTTNDKTIETYKHPLKVPSLGSINLKEKNKR